MTGRQKRHLRALAHALKPIVNLGKQGLSRETKREIESPIMVLFLFVLMLLSSKTSDQNTNKWPIGKILAGLLSFGIFLKIASLFTMGDLQLGPKGAYPIEVVEEVGSISLIGRLLFTDYILSFEIIAILLLVAVIGAVVIAKRRFH